MISIGLASIPPACIRRRPALFWLMLPFDSELPPSTALVFEATLLLVLSELLVESLLSPGGPSPSGDSSGESPPKISPGPLRRPAWQA